MHALLCGAWCRWLFRSSTSTKAWLQRFQRPCSGLLIHLHELQVQVLQGVWEGETGEQGAGGKGWGARVPGGIGGARPDRGGQARQRQVVQGGARPDSGGGTWPHQCSATFPLPDSSPCAPPATLQESRDDAQREWLAPMWAVASQAADAYAAAFVSQRFAAL